MTKFRALTLVPIISVLLALTASGGYGDPVRANHSSPGTVDTHIAHVHDDYFHPEPLSPTWADHDAAQADCQSANPPAQCDTGLEVGDSVEWWSKSPFHSQPHSVTECTNNTFSTCGANVDPNNPIGDSGIFTGGATQDTLRHGPVTFDTPGTFHYRCEVHPDVMRGRVVVAAAAQTPTPTPAAPTPTPVDGTPTPTASPAAATPAAVPQTGGPPADESSARVAALLLAGAAIVVLSGAGITLLRRR